LTIVSICCLGFRVDGDLKRLRESYPSAQHYANVANVQEIAAGATSADLGLDGLCWEVLGRRVDKRMQRSDWESRPLSAEQRDYAALDALVLIEIWRVLEERVAGRERGPRH
jgi:ribonuclease D